MSPMPTSSRVLSMPHEGASAGPLDAAKVREDFPILSSKKHCKPLVYLDNAATTQKPRAVIEAVQRFYEDDCSNIHRGVYQLSARATDSYEKARKTAQRFVNAAEPEEIVFVRGTTEAINLVATSFTRPRLRVGDEILVTHMEHHSNIVPWQLACEQTGAVLRVVPINDAGELVLDEFDRLLSERTRMVALVHVSNALGTVNPVTEIVRRAHVRGVPVLVDGAQAAPHLPIDVQTLDCDFYALSGHKIYGPTGIGVLYGKYDHLRSMPPYHGGGDMIRHVSFEKTTYQDPPYRFEAGTPNISGAIGLGAAIDYMTRLGFERIRTHEDDLLRYADASLAAVPGVRIIGAAKEKAGVVSFVHESIHPHDLGTILDGYGVAVRTGHHCAQPLMERFGVPATARASMGVYNTREDIDALIEALMKAIEVFR